MKTQFDPELLEMVTRGARWVWNDIAPDVLSVDEFDESDTEAVVEICLDADHLYTLGYADEYAAQKLLLETGDFQTLCKAIAKNW
jgi:hypothetical protein